MLLVGMIVLGLVAFAAMWAFVTSLRLGVGHVMFLLILSVLIGVYLLYAMLRPERF